ncbi:MAG: SUMF1/EgtB/PvdO family nonheme iron enzyme, partial [Ktedonobacterales bacterium]
MAPVPPPPIFLSHAHQDNSWCRQFVAHLRTALGNADPNYIFYDENSLQLGDNWLDRIQRELMARPIFLLVLTPRAITSDYVRREVALALRETVSHPERRLITLKVADCNPNDLAPWLLDYQMADFVSRPFDVTFAGLVGAIRAYNADWAVKHAPQPPAQPQPGGWGPPQQPDPRAGGSPPWNPGQPPAPQFTGQPPTPAAPAQQPAAYGWSAPPAVAPQPQPVSQPPTPVPAPPQTAPSAPAAASPDSPQAQMAKKLAKDTHDAYVGDQWVDVLRKGDFAMSLPENAGDARLCAEVTVANAFTQRWEQTRALAQRTLAMNPFYPEVWWSLARAQLVAGEKDVALHSFDGAFATFWIPTLRRAFQLPILRDRRGLLMDLQLYDEALSAIEREIDWTKDPDLLRERADLLMRLGISDDTEGDYFQRQFPRRLRELGFMERQVSGIDLIVPPLCDVPGGEFQMGSDPDRDPLADEIEQPVYSIPVADFQIARFPVTVAEYTRFVRAGGPEPSVPGGGNLAKPWDEQLKYPDKPVVCVSWRNAMAYAGWLADLTGELWRLPTEAEWEKAARWDAAAHQSYTYPWGDTWNAGRCNNGETGPGDVIQIGLFPGSASPCGAQEMVGSVNQWCTSLNRRYPYTLRDNRENLDDPGSRVARGSAYSAQPRFCRANARLGGGRPDSADKGTGFRLARGPMPGSAQGARASSGTTAGAGATPEAAAQQPTTPGQQLAREAHLAFRAGQWADAAAKGEQALALPENAANIELTIEVAQAYVASQQWSQACAAAQRALALDPFRAEAWQALGQG